jgi:A/G-specific adenine glycosylase
VKKEPFHKIITNWYSDHKRDLPWRNTHNPYYIWLSEIMLQQTRVNQGLPYYLAFTSQFEDVFALAQAPEQEVLRLWQGLGYYSRARNLHATAQYIATKLNGKFPSNYQDLLSLKGVGQYTAAAIASFAYDEKVAVVDGNVFRVLARYFGIDTDIASPAGAKQFTLLANKLLPDTQAATYNQGIMEFGALQCTPKNPSCHNCPLQLTCFAYQHEAQHLLPVKIKKLKIKERFFHYIIFEHQGKQLLHERTDKDIWKGLNDYYLIETNQLMDLATLFEHNHLLKITSQNPHKIKMVSSTYRHVLTHQKIQAQFIVMETMEAIQLKDYQYYTPDEIETLAKPVLLVNYINEHPPCP